MYEADADKKLSEWDNSQMGRERENDTTKPELSGREAFLDISNRPAAAGRLYVTFFGLRRPLKLSLNGLFSLNPNA